MFPYRERFLLIPLLGGKVQKQGESENTCLFDSALLYMSIVHKKYGKEDI